MIKQIVCVIKLFVWNKIWWFSISDFVRGDLSFTFCHGGPCITSVSSSFDRYLFFWHLKLTFDDIVRMGLLGSRLVLYDSRCESDSSWICTLNFTNLGLVYLLLHNFQTPKFVLWSEKLNIWSLPYKSSPWPCFSKKIY